MNLFDADDAYKILVVGPQLAGKTSFIGRYVHGDFNPAYRATMGVDFQQKRYIQKDGDNIMLQFWDIPGQEQNAVMCRSYYRDAKACIVMFDITAPGTLKICEEWKAEIDKCCSTPEGCPLPCLLLANKPEPNSSPSERLVVLQCDLRDRRVYTGEDIESFSTKQGFIHCMETSALRNINIKSAIDFLVDIMLREQKTEETPQNEKDEDIVVINPDGQPDSKGCVC